MPDKRKGLTLAELAVTLGVVAAVSLVVFLYLPSPSSQRREIEAASRQLMSDFRYARQRAILSGSRVMISFNAASGTYSIFYQDMQRQILTGRVPEGVTLLLPQTSVRQRGFTARGTPIGGGYSVILRNSRYESTLFIVGSGARIRYEINRR